jgi:hypothetical protein
MEDIDQRLRESTDACIKSFENWSNKNKDTESRESLMEALHEVRKVLARVEIEIAISERDRLGSRPLPIPPHRSSRGKHASAEGDDAGNFQDDGEDDNSGNGEQQQQAAPRRHQGGPRRRPAPRQNNNGDNAN